MKNRIKKCSEGPKDQGVPLGKPPVYICAKWQRPQRNTLNTLKEYQFKEINEKIISCALEIHSSPGPGLLENLYKD
jgi:glutamate formiminotransferase